MRLCHAIVNIYFYFYLHGFQDDDVLFSQKDSKIKAEGA